MALIKCSECGATVSDMAFVCPRCGFDVRALKESGHGCGDCGCSVDCEGYGPKGYPCLQWYEYEVD